MNGIANPVQRDDDAHIMTKRLAKEEGIFAGMSSGGAVHAAVEVSNELKEGVIVCIICDRGDRYLSSDLFDFFLQKFIFIVRTLFIFLYVNIFYGQQVDT